MSDQVFSINGEEFDTDDFGEILERLEDDGNVLGATYYTGTKLQRKPSEYFLLDDVLETMGDRAWDECGEYAQGFPGIGRDKQAELEKLIADWLDANVEVNFYTVTNVKQRKVTKADLKQQGAQAMTNRERFEQWAKANGFGTSGFLNGDYHLAKTAAAWEAWQAAQSEPAQADTVPMPQNADQAQVMANIGIKWLQDNAPERLKTAQAEPVVEDSRVFAGHAVIFTEEDSIVSVFSTKEAAEGDLRTWELAYGSAFKVEPVTLVEAAPQEQK